MVGEAPLADREVGFRKRLSWPTGVAWMWNSSSWFEALFWK